MAGRLEGKVAFITGAGRGQGRAHAVRMASEGADIIAVDICRQIESNNYPLATPEDLQETERAVKELDRRIVARQADVRERSELRDALEAGVTDLGRLDIVVANAGILPMALGDPHASDFVDATDVDLLGVMNTVAVSLPHLPDGASVIITGSTAGLMPGTTDNPVMGPGGDGYGWSKRTLVGYSEQMALHLASRFIRVNTIHPGPVDNSFQAAVEDQVGKIIGRDATRFFNEMIPLGRHGSPDEIARSVLYLASDQSSFTTGAMLMVDGGMGS